MKLNRTHKHPLIVKSGEYLPVAYLHKILFAIPVTVFKNPLKIKRILS